MRSERGGQAQGHVGGDARSSVEDAREGGAGDVQFLRRVGDIHIAQRVAQNFAAVRRVVHTFIHLVTPIS